jgi:hypothetical protein
MKIRSELKLIADALKSLKDDGIIRTKNLVGDLGEYYCSQLFKLTLNNNVVEMGFDAKDNDEKRVEIKTRRTPESKAKVIFRSFDFDYCLFVELNEYYEPKQIIKVIPCEIMKLVDKKGDRLSVSKLRKTEHVVVFKDNK